MNERKQMPAVLHESSHIAFLRCTFAASRGLSRREIKRRETSASPQGVPCSTGTSIP